MDAAGRYQAFREEAKKAKSLKEQPLASTCPAPLAATRFMIEETDGRWGVPYDGEPLWLPLGYGRLLFKLRCEHPAKSSDDGGFKGPPGGPVVERTLSVGIMPVDGVFAVPISLHTADVLCTHRDGSRVTKLGAMQDQVSSPLEVHVTRGSGIPSGLRLRTSSYPHPLSSFVDARKSANRSSNTSLLLLTRLWQARSHHVGAVALILP